MKLTKAHRDEMRAVREANQTYPDSSWQPLNMRAGTLRYLLDAADECERLQSRGCCNCDAAVARECVAENAALRAELELLRELVGLARDCIGDPAMREVVARWDAMRAKGK